MEGLFAGLFLSNMQSVLSMLYTAWRTCKKYTWCVYKLPVLPVLNTSETILGSGVIIKLMPPDGKALA